MGAGAVDIQVLVDVVDEVCRRAVGVLDIAESGGRIGGEAGGACPPVSWEENVLIVGACVANRCDGGLNGVCPLGHVGY